MDPGCSSRRRRERPSPGSSPTPPTRPATGRSSWRRRARRGGARRDSYRRDRSGATSDPVGSTSKPPGKLGRRACNPRPSLGEARPARDEADLGGTKTSDPPPRRHGPPGWGLGLYIVDHIVGAVAPAFTSLPDCARRPSRVPPWAVTQVRAILWDESPCMIRSCTNSRLAFCDEPTEVAFPCVPAVSLPHRLQRLMKQARLQDRRCTRVHNDATHEQAMRRLHPDLIHQRVHSGTPGYPVARIGIAATTWFP
jgi:hypothetical protein